jgi:N-acetylmuramoyl-L-alanine amidase
MDDLTRAGAGHNSAHDNLKGKIKVKSKYLYILDSGHGGLNPDTGKYVTSGKRSPMFDDGSVLYEGVENRKKVKAIMELMTANGLECVDIVNTWVDTSLGQRVKKANDLAVTRKCIYISVHSDAYGSGWTSPSGIGVYRFTGSQMSAPIAKVFREHITNEFDGIALDRKIKEAPFYVLRYTNCPAVLIEYGFHTNKEEAARMLTDDWIDRVARSAVNSCKEIELT